MSIIHWSVHSVVNVLQPGITTVTLDIGLASLAITSLRNAAPLSAFLGKLPRAVPAISSIGQCGPRVSPICGKKASLSASLKSRHQVPTGLYGADDVLTRLHPLHVKESSGKFQIGCIVIALNRRRCFKPNRSRLS